MAADVGVTVALDLTLDADLRAEGRVLDLIHALNSMRKEVGLDLTDRIVVTLPRSDADLLERYEAWIKDEVLAVRVSTDSVETPQIAKA